MKRLPVIILLTLLAGAWLGGCSCSSDKVEVAPKDTAAYNMGLRHAAVLLEMRGDESRMCDELLDIRSRESRMREHLRESAADAYIQGFTDYITEHDDSLAKVLFD